MELKKEFRKFRDDLNDDQYLLEGTIDELRETVIQQEKKKK